MRWALRFRIGGIPVRIEAAFFLVVLLLGWRRDTTPTLMAVWVAVALVSVLVHELGHAVVGRLLGDAPQIVLHGMLGYTIGSGVPMSRGKRVLVSLAGSLAGILVLGIPAVVIGRALLPKGALDFVFLYPQAFPITWVLIAYIAWANVVWSLLNLLPVLPFDGGNVATTLLEALIGERGRIVGHVVSVVIVAGLGVWSVARGSLYPLVFGAIVIGWNLNEIRERRDKSLAEEALDAYRSLHEDDYAAAADRAESVLSRARSEEVRRLAAEALMWARIDQGRLPEARKVVDRLPPGSAPPLMPRAYLAIIEEGTEVAVDATVRALLEEPKRGPGRKLVGALAGRGLVPKVVDHLFSDGREQAILAATTLAIGLHIAERFDESARVGKRVFEDGRVAPPLVAYNVACSLARSGAKDEALTWLDTAVGSGLDDRTLIDRDHDLDGLRQTERFATIRARIPAPPAQGSEEAGG